LPSQTSPCCTPGVGQQVLNPQNAAASTVQAQCQDRQTSNAVYCSCRCANQDGQTNDGAIYCQCPSGFTCQQQLVTAINSTEDPDLIGAYCIKNNTQYDPNTSCTSFCNPLAGSGSAGYCGPVNGVQQ
jgi:hypothetical protein